MLEFEASLQHWLEISYTLVSEFYKSWTEEQTPQASKQASKQLLQHVTNMPISNVSKDVTWISWTS
jgi:hypothetical protein